MRVAASYRPHRPGASHFAQPGIAHANAVEKTSAWPIFGVGLNMCLGRSFELIDYSARDVAA